MQVRDILTIDSLRNAVLLAGREGLGRSVLGVMVLEATDIENWGKDGQVILSSYYAMQNLSSDDLQLFFEKLQQIMISALIIKIDRLLERIPDEVISLCDTYSIPLIRINKEVKYESIILEILGPIINDNVSLLNRYYDIHNELTSLALKKPSLTDVLKEFKNLLSRDVTLINRTASTLTTTQSEELPYRIIRSEALPQKRYITFEYERQIIIYPNLNPPYKCSQLCVNIPNLGNDKVDLIIHENDHKVTPEDFMVIENAVRYLQMELLKKYAVYQDKLHHKNNLVSDLLNRRVYSAEGEVELLQTLDLSNYNSYRVILAEVYPFKEHPEDENNHGIQDLIRKFTLNLQSHWLHSVYLEKDSSIVLIINYEETQRDFDIVYLRNLMDDIYNHSDKSFYYQLAISTAIHSTGISSAYKECIDTQKILKLFHHSNAILCYDDLGIYKLFLNDDRLNDLQNYISPKIIEFKKKNEDLMETLQVYLDTQQSLAETAKKLFLHPKTIRYRIDKIEEMLNLDFENPEQRLQLQIAGRLFKLMRF
ncbi:PucR family transcriptional regulator [Acidaminobacter hydrogenoformans]|uniref:Purine catabolism regulatory protein n=1 Tax=Acidaminobacter hydrogenoformans DSM 2784 TaxID=1120920 RepID=A0A1G5S029_9FIRM|nr:PucR family transcriptional regulator [Acidaminobacter hydrogenoformans]SCZ79613.1 purine catabolism regulatory protein [Acidaminobacter hydrogenoformans DSM 2784]